MKLHKLFRYFSLVAAAVLASGNAAAQQDADAAEEIEEIVVTGSQIVGASISDALPVSVMEVEDIEALGIDSGDELLDFIAENGANFFNEAENISGGVNSVRGDIGAFNLRNLGTGNTLVLLNGRRMLNSPGFQTEEVGGSFVPVNTVNSNTIPVYGVQRLEVLRDGASAIYGADAVAGVVNTVLKTDFDGFTFRARGSAYDNTGRNDQTISAEWGRFFNDGATNIGVFFDAYRRDRVSASEDPRWADSDFRRRLPEGSPWAGETDFRNNSANSLYGQYDIVRSVSRFGLGGITDRSGEFETYPAGHSRCQWDLGYGTCAAPDGQGTYRYNLNEFRDLISELERTNVFVYLNHVFDNGMESFTEFSYYAYDSNTSRHPSAPFSTVKLRVGAQNYYNPFGPVGSPNRLPESVIGTRVPAEGLTLEIDNYRFAQVPRIVDNNGDSYRFLQGLRGDLGDWNWEAAFVQSAATRKDVTHNRISNLLIQEALEDPTPAAYNPFSGGVDSNIERALVDVYRNGETELTMVDAKFSHADLFELPAGPVGALAGVEFRQESFVDDRDPRLDGTIVFTDFQGDTFPFVSDVVNSSPTPDNRGERDVTSLFAEMLLPLINRLDAQVAVRYEDFSDIGDTTVGKLALGWRATDQVLVRGSRSEAFRAPNLVTINEEIVARQNTRTDYACLYAAENGGDPNQDTLDCRNSTQRIAQGSKDLRPEESTNTSLGIVIEPVENLTITLDYWSIEKRDTIGLFGEENHTILDLVQRLNHGTGDCSTLQANPAISREAEIADDEAAIYTAAGICPAGLIKFIDDRYANLDTRTVRGHDIGVYYSLDTRIGDFDLRYVASFLDEYEQTAGGDAAVLLDAKSSGLLPAGIPVTGFSDLVRINGNPEAKQNIRVGWRMGSWHASVTGFHIGDFIQDSLTLDDGTVYVVPSMMTFNTLADYTFDLPRGRDARIRLGINNVADERAPLADRYFGYFSDMHRDQGRYYYLDARFRY